MTTLVIDTIATLFFTALIPPFIGIVLILVTLASLGQTLGLRQKYVELLLNIFEFGKKRLAKNRKYLNSSSETNDDDESESDKSQTQCDTIFSRKNSTVENPNLERHNFTLSDAYDYIARGMEAIVDDEVTKRFSAEELTSWNFLTRTNLDYEFISVRLTVFWVVGFVVRYFFLLPLRVCILSIGVGYLVTFTSVLMVLPDGPFRIWLGNHIYLTAFRIVARGISSVIYFHNEGNRPKSDGICVANHTSPIDCVILSFDNVYAFIGLLVICTYVVGCLPNSAYKKSMNNRVSMYCFDFLSGCLSLVCTYHNRENIPLQGICVANHTSPMDVLVLACDNTYDMVGQRHGGLLGIFQRALSRASDHIWFERGEVKDRFAVAKRLKTHVEDPNKMPILIFPEGTCINNTSVMQFKKGTFEVGGIIYPVAIKYDARFGDAFWNSSKYSMISYIYMMMTSWAIVCDVWYLPPMMKKDRETSIEFANRVKAEIAKQGGLVDLLWDGALKRSAPKKELKEHYQQEFSRRLKLHDIKATRKIHHELYLNNEDFRRTVELYPDRRSSSAISETRRRRKAEVGGGSSDSNGGKFTSENRKENGFNERIEMDYSLNHDTGKYDEMVAITNGTTHESSHIESEPLREIYSYTNPEKDWREGLRIQKTAYELKLQNEVNAAFENHDPNSIDHANSELLEGINFDSSFELKKLRSNYTGGFDSDSNCLQNLVNSKHNGTFNDVNVDREITE